jgi:hypothetical protein
VLGVLVIVAVRCDPLGAAERFRSSMRGLLSPIQVTVQQSLTTALGDLRPDGGLIVGWREVQARVLTDRTTSIGAFGVQVPIGSVRIELDVPGNRVQYLLPAGDGWSVRALDAETVVLTVPPPVVNDRVVEVQSDPSRIRVSIDNDWAEHLIPNGGDIDKAKALIRAAVIETGGSRPALAEARIEARTTARTFFRGLFSQAVGSDVDVIVQFSDEADSSPPSPPKP